jgi:hypothetical protein
MGQSQGAQWPSFMRALISATGLPSKGVCPCLAWLGDRRAAGMLLQQFGELFQLLMLVLQANRLGGELGQLAGNQAFGLLPGKLRHVGHAGEQGSELAEFAAKLLGLTNDLDPFQIFRPVDAILAAPPGFRQQPHLFIEADRLGCGARQAGKFADIHIAARKGGVKRASL